VPKKTDRIWLQNF